MQVKHCRIFQFQAIKQIGPDSSVFATDVYVSKRKGKRALPCLLQRGEGWGGRLAPSLFRVKLAQYLEVTIRLCHRVSQSNKRTHPYLNSIRLSPCCDCRFAKRQRQKNVQNFTVSLSPGCRPRKNSP